MIPDSYVVQNGCHNCKLCFVKKEYDEGNQCLCNANHDRPPCDSVFMGEIPEEPMPTGTLPLEDFERLHKEREERLDRKILAWEAWAQCHEVSPSGLCHLWEQKETI